MDKGIESQSSQKGRSVDWCVQREAVDLVVVMVVVDGPEARKVVWDSDMKDLECCVLQRLEILMGARILQGFGENAPSDAVGLRLHFS